MDSLLLQRFARNFMKVRNSTCYPYVYNVTA